MFIQVGVEGLQTLKPQQHKKELQTNGHKETIESHHGGVNLESHIVLSEDNNNDDGINGVIKWIVESLKFSVKHPVITSNLQLLFYVYIHVSMMGNFVISQVEAIVTKHELQHVAKLCKSEVDSMGRITAGVLRVFKLENSIGQTAMDQLTNLGKLFFFLNLKQMKMT